MRLFACFSSIVAIFVIYSSANEADHYHQILMRMMTEGAVDGIRVHYASQFSLLTQTLIFMANFGIFMIYLQMSMLG